MGFQPPVGRGLYQQGGQVFYMGGRVRDLFQLGATAVYQHYPCAGAASVHASRQTAGNSMFF
jgi:hypothetical protein